MKLLIRASLWSFLVLPSVAWSNDDDDWLASQDETRTLRYADGTPASSAPPKLATIPPQATDGNLVVPGLRRADEGLDLPTSRSSTPPRINISARKPTTGDQRDAAAESDSATESDSASERATETRGSALPETESPTPRTTRTRARTVEPDAEASSEQNLEELRNAVLSKSKPVDWQDLESEQGHVPEKNLSDLESAADHPVLYTDGELLERRGSSSMGAAVPDTDPAEDFPDDVRPSLGSTPEATPAVHFGDDDDRSDATYDGWVRDQILDAFKPRGSTVRENVDFQTRVVVNVDETGRVASPVIVYTNATPDFHASIQKAITKAHLQPPPPGEGQGIVIDFYADASYR